MDDDEKAQIARQGVELVEKVEQLSPVALRERLSEAAGGVARNAVLGGVRVIGDLTGTGPRRPRVGPSAEAVERTLERMEAESTAQFDAELREALTKAAAHQPEPDERLEDVEAAEARELVRLRRTFPAASKELAILLFACVDLLEDLAELDDRPSEAELAKKELLIARIGALLAPRAEAALVSFVGHVVELSRKRRTEG